MSDSLYTAVKDEQVYRCARCNHDPDEMGAPCSRCTTGVLRAALSAHEKVMEMREKCPHGRYEMFEDGDTFVLWREHYGFDHCPDCGELLTGGE